MLPRDSDPLLLDVDTPVRVRDEHGQTSRRGAGWRR
jgi:hypothetical protein